MLSGKSILITGGTGSFGNTFVLMTLKKFNPSRLVIYSRDEMKQWNMAKKFENDARVRFFIGDIRDKDRLMRALDGIDYVVHGAATKIVPTAEYNPFECVKTNINGAMNLIDACIDKKVKRVVAPYKLTGLLALSVESATMRLTFLSIQASIRFIAPLILVFTHSNGLYSAVGTIFVAAPCTT
jgi:NAD(P)-dependent dehydrogenase (short-subunit alcohol dehydrogenase family)